MWGTTIDVRAENACRGGIDVRHPVARGKRRVRCHSNGPSDTVSDSRAIADPDYDPDAGTDGQPNAKADAETHPQADATTDSQTYRSAHGEADAQTDAKTDPPTDRRAGDPGSRGP